jgi:hypothetical protein
LKLKMDRKCNVLDRFLPSCLLHGVVSVLSRLQLVDLSLLHIRRRRALKRTTDVENVTITRPYDPN